MSMSPQELVKWAHWHQAGPVAFARHFALYATCGFASLNLGVRLAQDGPVKWISWLFMAFLFAVVMHAIGTALWQRQDAAYRKQTNTGA